MDPFLNMYSIKNEKHPHSKSLFARKRKQVRGKRLFDGNLALKNNLFFEQNCLQQSESLVKKLIMRAGLVYLSKCLFEGPNQTKPCNPSIYLNQGR